MERFEFGGEIVWRPTPEYTKGCRLARFIQRHGIANLEELMRRSTVELEWFWNAVMDDLRIEFYARSRRLLKANLNLRREPYGEDFGKRT